MSGESEAVRRTPNGPVTRTSIRAGLTALGIAAGDWLLVHASLSAFGFVTGGAQAVVQALQAAVGEDGLLTMPSFTSHLSDPRYWQAPPVPEAWWPTIRAETPPFDLATTPSRGIGAVAEQLRTAPGAIRGPHPQDSFVAWGREAHSIVAPHELSDGLGDRSPLGRLYEFNAKVLFLGTGYGNCTAFHLAEHRAARLARRRDGAPVTVDGERQWVEFDAPVYDTGQFEALGREFEAQDGAIVVAIGAAMCRTFKIRDAVDFAEARMRVGP